MIRNKKKTPESDAFFDREHRLDNPIASLQCARVNESIIHVTPKSEKHPSTCYSKQTPKTQQVESFMSIKITSDFCSSRRAGWYACASENFAYLSCFAKFPFL